MRGSLLCTVREYESTVDLLIEQMFCLHYYCTVLQYCDYSQMGKYVLSVLYHHHHLRGLYSVQ